ncbi:signal recognition particle protein [Candidatus Poribacteria bacterium]|nr:signal recognition particle protein [Candidatus Poribacteria bacterium]
MFESLSEKLDAAFKGLRGRGRLTEKNIRDVLREVRLALLEADVNFQVARDFMRRVQERALAQDVLKSLTPDQQVLTIVSDELTTLMGDTAAKLAAPPSGTQILLMVGLNGAGKTTACAKLALSLQKQGKKPLLAACDIYRPAAIKQLQVLGEQIDVPVHAMGTGTPPPHIAMAALSAAQRAGNNVVILDTAGRMQTNDELMDELDKIASTVKPTDRMLVVDATTGQEAVSVAEEFHRRLDLTGIVLSKMDGDARGGSALSIRAVTEVPIMYFGTGEKIDALEDFHPDRIASRILGQGDMLSLIEKAEAVMDEEKAQELEAKIMEKQGLTFEDFLDQLAQIRRMGSLDQVLGMIPGFDGMKRQGLEADEGQMKRVEAIILSMTPQERQDHRLLDASRKRRIAKGSGTSVQQINQLVQQLAQMNRMMKQIPNMMSGGKNRKQRRAMKQAFPIQ